MTKNPIRSKFVLFSSASILALLVANPALATTLSGLSGHLPTPAVSIPISGASAGNPVSATQAAAATVQSTTDFSNALAAIQSQMSAQAAAHSAAPSAAALAVPNGLAAGGLVPDSGLASSGTANSVITWVGANTPTQTTSGTTTTVTITQTQQKAIANWSSFNVGANTVVHFDQSAGNNTASNGSLTNSWVILNRINNSASPAQIFGTIQAEGSVYLLDSNGILFGASSQVNVHSLVASSLCLFSCTIGDANTSGTSNYRFLDGGIGDLNSTNAQTNSILFTSSAPGAGNITIDQGAEITGGNTGLVLIAAPNVTNDGSIAVPAGQAALIAGIGVSYTYNSIYVNGGGTLSDDGSSTILIFSDYGKLADAHGKDITPVGTLDNEGLISTPRGNITLLGGAIEQNGIAVATTSVNQAGSIVVDSTYETAVTTYGPSGGYTGAVSFGPQAVTAILPDTNGVTLASDATSLAPWQSVTATLTSPLPQQGFGIVNITGQAIDFEGGSLTYAPGQRIDAEVQVTNESDNSALDPRYPVAGSGRLFVESGAALDVSGMANIELPDSYNLLTVKLAGNELADDPEQQAGFLYGKTITVDMRDTGTNAETGESWVGTPLANLASYANLRQNSIDQLLVNGGTIGLGGNEVDTAQGSVLNLAGGYVHFLGGTLDTTQLIDAAGNIVDISKADPNDTYVGFAGQSTDASTRWGISGTATSGVIDGGTYEADYIQGGNAGTLTIGAVISVGTKQTPIVANSGAFVLDATLLGGALAGTRQVEAGTLPTGGSFTFSGSLPIEIGDPGVLSASSLQALSLPSDFTMSSPLLATTGSGYANGIVLSSKTLDNANFSAITINNENPIVEDAGTTLAVQPGGSISLSGNTVTIDGNLTARSGAIDIATAVVVPSAGAPLVTADITIGPGVVLDVSGLFVNDAQLAPGQLAAPTLVNGGSISLVAGTGTNWVAPPFSQELPPASATDLSGNITLSAGSLLNLEGGGRILPNGQLQTVSSGAPAGSGGNLTLETYTGLEKPFDQAGDIPARGKLVLDGTIKALGMSGGGTLTLQQVAFQVGGNAATTPSYAYYFDPTAWGDLGFASFNLSSVLQSEVPAGATVTLHHLNLLPDFNMISAAPTGSDPADYATPGSLTGTLLSPTNLSITAGLEEAQNYNSDTPSGQDYAQIDAGAEIIGDPAASISMSSYAMTTILGSIVAPGGNISLTVYPQAEWNMSTPMGPLYLSPNTTLDVSGTTVINPLAAPVFTADGYVTPYTGKILAGGTVSLTSASPILMAPSAVINVDGASGAFDVAQAGSGFNAPEIVTREPQWSNAGNINIKAFNMLLEGTLLGFGGAPEASGATLTISGNSDANGDSASLVMVQDTAAALAAANVKFDFSTYVPTTIEASPGSVYVPGLGFATLLVGADKIDATKTGIDNLILGQGASFGFSGNVTLNLNDIFAIDSASYFGAKAGNINWGYGGPSGSTNGASLTVNAKYVRIGDSDVVNPSYGIGGTSGPGDATMTFNADQIDLIGFISTAYIGQTNFFSTGEIRLLPEQEAPSGGIELYGYLSTDGNVAFKATDVYPTTDTAFIISANQVVTCYACAPTPPTTVSFAYPDGGAPSTVTPLSAGGAVVVDASNIIQDGEISAPFGAIILGVPNGSSVGAILQASGIANNMGTTATSTPTQSVTLGNGSITSVSANGTTIPYGSTVDQTSWVYNPLTNNPSWDGGQQSSYTSAYTVPLTQAPQGVVSLSANAVDFNSGATVNIDGGGDLEAAEWIPGTGGSRNVLSQYNTSYANSTTGTQVPLYPDARQIYAIVPSYKGAIAPYDATLSQGIPTAGQAIYLSGGDGLAAGVYTLLPAQYATLPGAYRVVMNTGVTNPLVTQTQILPDGTMVMTGYLTNDITGARPSVTEQFQVQSASVWEKYSQYTFTSANSFFPTYASTNNLAVPYVPNDAGRLVLAPATELTLDGTLEGTPGKGGTGAEVDVSGEYLNIDDTASGVTSVPTGALNLSGPNTSGVVANGGTITFGNGISSSDLFTITGSGTFVIPTGGTAVEPVTVRQERLIAANQAVLLPAGDTLTTYGNVSIAVQTAGADTISVNAYSNYPAPLTLPTSSTTAVTLPSTSLTLKYSSGSGTGSSAITISSPSEFSVGGINAPLVNGVYTTTSYTASQVVKGSVANQTITWTTGTSGGNTSGAGGALAFGGSGTATVTLGTTLAGGSSTYQLGSGSQVSLTAVSPSDLLTGQFNLIGPNGSYFNGPAAGVVFTAGAYTITSSQQFESISAGSTFIANAMDSIAYTSGSGAVVLPTSITYLDVSAKQLDALDATSLLIGGTRQMTADGIEITPTSNGITVANDASAPLTAPEIMLVAAPQFQNSTSVVFDNEGDSATIQTPIAGTGLVTFLSGSVVEASGSGSGVAAIDYLIGKPLSNLPQLPTSVVASSNTTTEGIVQAYYRTLDATLGTFVRLSTGSPVKVQMPDTAQLAPGTIAVEDNLAPATVPYTINLPSLLGSASGVGAVIQSGAKLEGGNVLTIATTGDTTVQSGALLSGTNISAASSSITFVGSGATAPTSGLVIDAGTLAQFEQSTNVDLESYGAIAFKGNVNLAMANPASTLTLGGDSLTSDGGAVSIAASTLVLDNETNTQGSVGSGTGSLSIDVGELVFGSGSKSLSGFGSASLVANKGVVGQGTGSMNFGSLPVTLQTPVVIADTASDQILTTSGALSVTPVSGGTAMTSDAVGGAITLQGASVTVSAPVEAEAGNIALLSSAGDITVTGTGSLISHGVAKQFGSTTEYASGGMISLAAAGGTVNLQSGSVVDFAGAAGGGDGGSLSIGTSGSTTPVTLGGTLEGATAAGATASNFSLDTAGTVAFDALAQSLTSAGVAGDISVEAGAGDLSLSHNLTANQVSLTADAGNVNVTGAITANGAATTSGEINLYGAKGVDLEGSLLATASPNSQKPGGIVAIGTSGTGSTSSLNATYGYENVDPSASGTITIGPNATIDASGGTVTFRAPILDALNAQGMNVNLAISPTAQIKAGSVLLDAYAVWSTADQSSNPAEHFDGIVDPAGWYGSNGTLVAGNFQDISGNAVATWDGTALNITVPSTTSWTYLNNGANFTITTSYSWDSSTDTLTGTTATTNNSYGTTTTATSTVFSGLPAAFNYFLTNDYFTPTSTNAAHAVFYGGYNPNSESFNPASPDAGSLPAFVQQPGLKLGTAFSGIANFTARPEIDLVNPSPANGGVNNGTISVLTNWNLGAGVINPDGSITLAYRYLGNIAPVIALRAAGDFDIKASITDGFFQSVSVTLPTPPKNVGGTTYASALNAYNNVIDNYGTIDTTTEIYFYDGSAELVAGADPNFTLVAPQQGGSSLYYQDYTAYAGQLYSTWATDVLWWNNGYFVPITAPQGVAAAPVAPLASDPTYAADYQTYLAAYDTWLQNNFTPNNVFTAGTPPAPSAPLQTAQYQSYASEDTNYLNYLMYTDYDYNTYDALYPYAPVAPAFIASSGGGGTPVIPPVPVGANAPSNMPTAADPLPVQFAALMAEQSTSYRLVAGAVTSSVNPLAVNSNGAGNVEIDGHIALNGLNTTNAELVVPTTVRTGTGSIDIAAAGDFELLDQLAPGAVYTAGTPASSTTSTGSSSIARGAGAWNYTSYNGTPYAAGIGISTILTPEVNPTNAGNITLTVGDDIIGVENVVDTLARGNPGSSYDATLASGLTSDPGAFIGQFWLPWLLTNSTNPNVPWYVNFGSFDQGIMSVGGDIAVKAGGDIHDLAVSTATTSWLDGSNTQHITGGGDLSVIAGGNIYSGDFYVGQGAGSIRAGGAITSDFTYESTDLAYPVQTLLAVQYGTIDVEARQSANIGGVYDPTYLYGSGDGGNPVNDIGSLNDSVAEPNLIPYVTSMSPNSGASIESAGGNVVFNSLIEQAALFDLGQNTFVSSTSAFDGAIAVSSLLLPASLNLVAFDGGIDIQHGGGLYPSATGTLDIVADQSIDLAIPLTSSLATWSPISQTVVFSPVGNVSGTSLGKLDYRVGAIDSTGDAILPTGAAPTLINQAQLTPVQYEDPSLVQNGATASVLIYSLNGDFADGARLQLGIPLLSGSSAITGSTIGQISLIPNAPTQIYAAGNITDLPFYGENFTGADVTSIIAGGEIGYNFSGNTQPATIEIAGPGTLDIEAGGSIDFQTQRVSGSPETGIRTIGNSIDPSANPDPNRALPVAYPEPTFFTKQFGNPYLPTGGASVNVLFGVGPGIDYADFTAKYVDPTQGASVIADEPTLLTNLVAGYEKGLGNNSSNLTTDQAWSIFATMPAAWQHLIDDQIFLDVLNETGLDYNNPNSSHFNQYARGYQAINTLFPASYGYTQNELGGGTNGANALVVTGNLDMRGSTIQTQQGGNIALFGPGGRILVGSSGAAPAVNPASEGVLTLESGNISTFTDTDVLVAQSRVMTEQGGDILMWSSNGNLDAGKGAKTSVSAPPPKYACDLDFYCIADLKGEVSGAGIATLQSLPGVPVGDANLIAPRGTVDAGAAGIRVSGNLNIASLYVANVFNITVQGKTIGIPVLTTNLNLATISNAATEASALVEQLRAQEPRTTVDVEVTGFGGDYQEPEVCMPSATNSCPRRN